MATVVHGDQRVDDWAWLRDRHDPAVLEHLRAENAYTQSATAHLAELRETLFEEIRSRIEETDLSVPVRKGPWWYFTRTFEGKDYGVHCRLPVEGGGRDPDTPPQPAPGQRFEGEETILDENELAVGSAYLSLGALAVSPDHSRLAYAVDLSGDERFTLRFRDLATGEDLTDVVEDVSYGGVWGNDNTTVLYTRADSAHRPYQVHRHTLGADTPGDTLVLQEDDERFHVGIGRTKDDRYLQISLHSSITSEVHLLDADDARGRRGWSSPAVRGSSTTSITTTACWWR